MTDSHPLAGTVQQSRGVERLVTGMATSDGAGVRLSLADASGRTPLLRAPEVD